MLSQQFGAPQLHRDASLNGSVTYEWDAQYGIHIRLNEPVRPAGADTFLVVVARFRGAPTSIPTAAEGEHWLERTVSLLTGSDLLAAHGMQAVRLVDAAMKPDPVLGDGCATSFSTSGVTVKQPIAYGKTLFLNDAASDCDDPAFVQLSLKIWQRPPVTAQALVERLEAKLGRQPSAGISVFRGCDTNKRPAWLPRSEFTSSWALQTEISSYTCRTHEAAPGG